MANPHCRTTVSLVKIVPGFLLLVMNKYSFEREDMTMSTREGQEEREYCFQWEDYNDGNIAGCIAYSCYRLASLLLQ